jgi:hypothetical protein
VSATGKAYSGPIHPDEPYFWFRGQDALAPPALQAYANACRAAATALADVGGDDAEERARELRTFAADVDHVAAEMVAWQSAHPELTKLPD